MTASFFLIIFLIFCGAGILSLIFSKYPFASCIGAGGIVIGSVLGFLPVFHILSGGAVSDFRMGWNLPLGSFHIGVDGLSAWLLFLIFLLAVLTAIYGCGYLESCKEKKALGAHWFFFNLLITSMAMVVIARDAILFLLAWEVMSVSSFFLVTFDHEKEKVRQAGWTYLVAAHFGAAFLFVFFLIFASKTGSFDFDLFGAANSFLPNVKSLLFILALVGFGTKAGFIPFHVWLPEAHPAAPSHVSALMSGVMIKIGIYGLLRALIWMGAPLPWWGWLLIGIGLTSGILGALFAFAQKDLKRLLAYSSVENIGIITLGIGIGVIGLSSGMETVAVLGFAGALFHLANHALFKGILFLAAGSVLHGTGTVQLHALGGLLKKMRWTGTAFFVGACAISGLPPLNGFISEFLIYLGALQTVTISKTAATGFMIGVIGGLALIGGLATAIFTKAFGIVFLGEPRTEPASKAHESGPRMTVPLIILAAGCLAMSLLSFLVIRIMVPVLQAVTSMSPVVIWANLANVQKLLMAVSLTSGGLLSAAAILLWVRSRLLSGREVNKALTWDCGFAEPSPRMQYSAGSYSEILMTLTRFLMRVQKKVLPPEGFFPRRASLSIEPADTFSESLYRPIFRRIGRRFSKFHWIQSGRTQMYVLYVALTLLILFMWGLK